VQYPILLLVKEVAEMEEIVNELREAPGADVVSHIYSLDGPVISTGTMTLQLKPEVTKTK